MNRDRTRRHLLRLALPAAVALLGGGALARRWFAARPVPAGAIAGARTGLVWERQGARRVAHHFVEFELPAGARGPFRVVGPWRPDCWGCADGDSHRFRAGFRWPWGWPYPGSARAWSLWVGQPPAAPRRRPLAP